MGAHVGGLEHHREGGVSVVKLLEQATCVGLAEENFATGLVGLKLKRLVECKGRRGWSLKGGGVLEEVGS